MNKKIILCLAALVFTQQLFSQIISISAARQQAIGNVVTVSGIVTSGSELGTIRYMQDGTAGIAVFSAALSGINRGDVITVTGTLDDYFNLLEINPVSSLTINSTGNSLPASLILTPQQFSDNDESEIVQVNNATFTSGGVFAGNANYSFTAAGQSGTVRVVSNSGLVGTAIPTGAVNITGLLSQYQSGYQLLPRDANDIVLASAFYITSQPVNNNISQSGFDVNWQTNLAGSSYIEYGHTPLLELGILNGAGGSANHTVSISVANPSDVFYVKAFSVNGIDTASSGTKVFITASASSGNIKVYFNRDVNTTVANSPSNFAVQLYFSSADTLAAYIDRTQFTLDIAIYNFDDFNTSVIINAINNAYTRGVQIRIVDDGSNANNAMPLLNANIPVLPSPTLPFGYYGIMHNKFVVMDAGDANLAHVWTGSTNFTDDQLNIDANNTVIFQDQSMAKVYTMEFEEMWGSNTALPNAANSKFGPDKTDNTPHELLIGGKRVECFFSPSDNVNNQILGNINMADYELYFATLVFTRYDLAYGIENRVTNNAVFAAGIVDDTGNGSSYAYNIMQTVMGNNLQLYNHASLPGILHHKYLIADQSHPNSDPIILTGSHNWSTSANAKNDENTVVIHDENIANQFYQEFVKRMNENGIPLSVTQNNSDNTVLIYPNPATNEFAVCNLQFEKNAVLSVYDLTGKEIISETIENKVRYINTSDWKSGIYFYSVTGNGKNWRGKISVIK